MSYDDIIDLKPYHNPEKPYMPPHDRAAQFAPYRSLVGYEEMINEKAAEVSTAEDPNYIIDEFDF